ncbi:MAG: Xaa-Pro peptidase family protein [Candidatus Electrothrix sp. GW3-4]|uniref:M24 family metallopeptidase n=1 Tax=Candidatus Electrothrix sp. GW3-4 TaxID=3126740 RepID=UPI0030CEAA69
MNKQRVKKLQKTLQRRKLDAVLITEPHNRRYLSGYTAADHGIQETAGVLLIPKKGRPWLLTDSRFALQAEEEAQGFAVELYTKGIYALLKKLLPALNVRRLGFESHYFLHSSSAKLEDMAEKVKVELVPLLDLVERMRAIKTEEEIQLIKESVLLNEQVFQAVYKTLAPGMTEIEIALALEQSMQTMGAEGPSFETIVAFGSNAAKPHAVPTNRVLQDGEIVLIDMGLVLQGYCSDMTRTFVIGKAKKKFKQRLRIVRKAQLAGIKAIRAGAVCREVDKAARKVIADAGYGDFFGHSLGHGVGLAVHEAPGLGSRNRKKLQAGMIVTIEPGIYLPDWGGIRLENMAVVREDGCEVLNEDSTGLEL